MNDFQKYIVMLMVLGECRKHYRNAQDLYAARYPDRQQKSRMAFKRLAGRFGTVKQTRVKRRPINDENNAAAILAFAALNPHASSRQMEKKSRISQRSVLRILHQHKFHPYRMSLHQDLYENLRWMRIVPFQHPWSVNCWCGIVGDHVIGPYFFKFA